MKKTNLLTSCALAALATTPAFAQEVIELDKITISANEDATALERSGTTVEVVNEATLTQAPGTRLSDVLTGLPGVTSSSNGGLGTSTNLRLRGLGGAYVPVYFDGINVSDPASSGNGFDWGGITSANVSRVEVLKGSQSARYGVSAVGGVVTLESWRPTAEGVSGEAFAEFGTYGTGRAGLSLGLLTDRTELSVGLSRVTTDGFSAVTAGTEADGYSENRATLRAIYHLTDTVMVGLSALYLDADGEFDEWNGDGAAPFDEANARTNKGVRLFSEFQTGAVSHELSYSYFETDRTSVSNGNVTPFNGTRKAAKYVAAFDLGQVVTMNAGADFNREEANGASSEIVGTFAEASISATDMLDVVVSVRHDDMSTFANETTGRLALAWHMAEDVIIRAQAATGYKPPSLFQLTSAYGNASFLPETSKSFELGVEKRFGVDGFVRATAFQTDIDGQVYWDGALATCANAISSGWPGCYNVQDFSSRGLELSGQIAIGDGVDLVGNFTWTEAEDASGNRALRVPLRDLELGVNAQLTEKTQGSISLNHVMERVDTVGIVPDYTVVNANVSHKLSDTTQAYLRVENLLDEDYQTAAGYNTSGRAFYFGVRASF